MEEVTILTIDDVDSFISCKDCGKKCYNGGWYFANGYRRYCSLCMNEERRKEYYSQFEREIMKKCLNIGCEALVSDKQFCCSQECGYTHYVRKTLNELNVIADRENKRSFEFSVETAKYLIDGYKQGKTTAQLSAATGVWAQTVTKFIFNPTVMANFKIRRRRHHRKSFTPEELALLQQDFATHKCGRSMTNVEIAAKYNSSVSAVYRARQRYDENVILDDGTSSLGFCEPDKPEIIIIEQKPTMFQKLMSFFRSPNAKREREL